MQFRIDRHRGRRVRSLPCAVAVVAIACLMALAPPRVACAGNVFFTGAQSSPFFAQWSDYRNWSTLTVPQPGDNVSIDSRSGSPSGVDLNVDATISNLTVANLQTVGAQFSLADYGRTLNVTGTTTLLNNPVGFLQPRNGCTYSLGTLLNQSNGTLLNGAYFDLNDDPTQPSAPVVVQWHGANIVRNEGAIVIGPFAHLRDQDTGLDALRNFNQNGGDFIVTGATYVTPGAFSNFGDVTVQFDDDIRKFARFQTGGTFVNFDAASGVLNGGHIIVKGDNNGHVGGRAEFAFPGADIQTLAPGTSIELVGDAAIVDSDTGANGLRHLGSLSGSLSVANALGLTPSGGALKLLAGTLNVQTNGALTVIGDLQQFNGQKTTINRKASLTILGNSTIRGDFGFDPKNTSTDSIPTAAANGWLFIGGSYLSGTGDLIGPTMIINGNVIPGILIAHSPAAAAASTSSAPTAAASPLLTPGRINLNGAVTLTGTAVVDIGIAGTTPGTGFSVLHQTGPGGLGLAGTLEVVLNPGYLPLPSDVFTIIESDQLSGVFMNAGDLARLNTFGGEGSFLVSYNYDAGHGFLTLSSFQAVPEPGLLGLAAIGLLLYRRRG